ncbi:MAG: outer membrane lipid asymmetry maintenance protein MlaD [Rhodospirillaceae bacterium]|nr:outer membrane lipid asymmetry maintenance protein MlaD [Rhodospirillaceae bacterium]HAA91998.1 outer membrane lipid asymmetry maintenance protein MlaD [Rhodospirillaceae bacterium]
MGEDAKHEIKHILLGILVVALTAVFFFLSYQSGPKGQASGYLLSARFNATDGIAVGSDVVLTGIKVGQVTTREYDSKKQSVRVEMAFREDINIPQESTVSIVSDGLLGAKYLKIEPGGSEDNMKSGDEFEFVQDSIPLVELLEKIVIEAEEKRAQSAAPPPAKKKDNPFSVLNP